MKNPTIDVLREMIDNLFLSNAIRPAYNGGYSVVKNGDYHIHRKLYEKTFVGEYKIIRVNNAPFDTDHLLFVNQIATLDSITIVRQIEPAEAIEIIKEHFKYDELMCKLEKIKDSGFLEDWLKR